MLTISLWTDKNSNQHDIAGQSFPVIRELETLENNKSENSTGNRIINVFASWCVPCIVELPVLKEAREELNIPTIGIAWKDDAATLKQWLKSNSNPFDIIYNDTAGAFGIEIGIRGIPETFVIDQNNIILFHHRGPLMRSHIDKMKELLEQ